MTEIDFKNLKIIEEFVSNHFSFSSESLKIFKQKLYEPETDPFIQKLFGDTKDFRIRFPVTDKLLESFDQGWKLFLSNFRYFVQSTGIDYPSFRANKVTFKRQAMKLKKAIFDFYLEDEALAANLLRSEHFNSKDEYEVEALENRIIGLLDKVGVAKLPSTGMEIVASLNFSDWFISSTGENWTSCLNLESNFSGCFWSGIPGLVIDKNRVMLYITNKTKKNYKGIITESVLSRTWAMLNNRDEFNVIRYFPAEKISTKDIRTITGIPLVQNFDWISKNPLEFLFFDENKSAFIYQDFSKFNKLGGKWFIKGSEQGRYGYIEKNSNELVENIHIFGYKGGLGKLVESKTCLSKITKHTCNHCGETFEEELEEFEERRYCCRCLSQVTIVCSDCGERIHKERGSYREVVNGNNVCVPCFDLYYTGCDDCHIGIRKENIINFNHGKFCKNCLKENETIYKYCMTCNHGSLEEDTDYENNYLILENEEVICKSCLKKEIDKKQLFLDLPILDKKNSLWKTGNFQINYPTTASSYTFDIPQGITTYNYGLGFPIIDGTDRNPNR